MIYYHNRLFYFLLLFPSSSTLVDQNGDEDVNPLIASYISLFIEYFHWISNALLLLYLLFGYDNYSSAPPDDIYLVIYPPPDDPTFDTIFTAW